MNNNYTHLSICLDRSGSMYSIAQDMEGGLQELVKEQKQQPGKCTLSFVRFDTAYEKPLDFADISIVEPESLKLEPRGGTALVDSLARLIRETGQTLDAMPENERPSLVTVVVVTDGEENSSREVTSEQLKQMIEEQQNKYNWQFNYLGANQDSFSVAQQYGIKVSNVTNYQLDKADKVFRNFSGKMSAARGMSAAGCSLESVASNLQYTNEDKEELN